jgi:hypothetical protein
MSYGFDGTNPDILAAGPADEPRRSKIPAVLSVIGVVVVVAAAGGGLFAYHTLAATGAMPDTLAPASSIAFAELDLDPSASEKVSAYEFEQKFPSLPKAVNADALKDTLLNAAFNDAGDTGSTAIDYGTQIKPWLGNRVAIDEFVDSQGQPQTVGIVQLKNAGQAGPALTQLTATQGGAYLIKGSYAVIGKSKTVVDDAAAQAAKSTINDNTTYSKDVATLKSDRILTAWWDAGATATTLSGKISQLFDSESQALGAPSIGGSTVNSSIAALSKLGRVVIGLRLTSNSAELEGRGLGGTSGNSVLQTGNAVSLLGALPSSTIGGFSLADPSAVIKADLAAAQANSTVGPALQKDLADASTQLGITVPADIENLLGTALSAGIQGIPHTGVPPFTVITAPTDPATAAATAQKIVALATKDGASVQATSAGANVVFSGGAASSSGTLGDLAAFQSMFGSMPTSASIAGYVNLTSVWAAEPSAPADAQQLTGVGFVVGKDATSPVFDIKLTVG